MKQQPRHITEPEEICSICMVRKVNCNITPCQHKFCSKCINRWSKKQSSCPFCRQQFTAINTKRKSTQVKPIRNIRESAPSRRSSLNTNINGNYFFALPMVFYYPVDSLNSFFYNSSGSMENRIQYSSPMLNMNPLFNFNFSFNNNSTVNGNSNNAQSIQQINEGN